MELEDNFVRQFIAELTSHVPVVLPTLLIFTIESGASLKLWHAVRQLPHLEKDTAPDDCESRTNAEHMYQVRAIREAAKKEARRTRIHQVVFCLVLVIITLFDLYVTLSGWLNRSREGEESDGYVGPGADEESEFDGQSGNGYGWYYDSVFGQIDWAKSYFAITLFLPAVYLLARTLLLISGLKDRVVLRDTKGVPFMAVVKGNRFSPRRPSLLAATVVMISAFLSAGAVLYHSSICDTLLFASMVHFMISNFSTNKVVAFKTMVIVSVLLVVQLWLLFGQLLSSQDSFPIRVFPLAHLTGDVNWNGLIFTALVCIGIFNSMAMCYRMDHAFACPDEFLVGSPDVSVTASVSTPHGSAEVDLRGTRISYFSRRRFRSSCGTPSCARTALLRRHRWPKPYFHTSILSWLFAYALIAMSTVLGYIECEAEFAGVYALYVAPLVMSLCLLVCATLRGEVKKVWAYKEDWAADPVEAGDVTPEAVKEPEEEKVLIEIESD